MMTGTANKNELIEAWKIMFKNEVSAHGKAWVVFKHGTVVLVEEKESEEAVTEAAKQLMKQDGPVIAGTQHGDFNIIDAPSVKGTIVTGHCPVMFNIVLPTMMEDLSNEMIVGLTGRSFRDDDSKDCEVIYVQMAEA